MTDFIILVRTNFLKLINILKEQYVIFTSKVIVFIKEKHHFFKISLILFSHILGAFIIAYIGVMVLVYLGFVGELSSASLLKLWHKMSCFFLPTLILFLSILVVILSNPVYALVSLIAIFFCTALFLLSIQVNFLAMIYLIIYIGAIAILFLFVIMMFNLRELKSKSTDINDYSFISISFSFYLLILAKFYTLILNYIITYVDYDAWVYDFAKYNLNSIQYTLTYYFADSLLFGTLLYEYYTFLFLVAGMLLLTSMLGSIILALSTTEKTMNSNRVN